MDPDVGQLIRTAREGQRISQTQLARRAGTTQAVVSKIERGVVSPTMETVRRLLAAMGWELELGIRRSRWQDPDVEALRAYHALTPQQRFDAFLATAPALSRLHGAGRAPRQQERR